jgi:hypothetical protein
VAAEFPDLCLGQIIIRLSIATATRRRAGLGPEEPCLALYIGRHFYLEAERRYEFRESRWFTFTEASFEELPL